MADAIVADCEWIRAALDAPGRSVLGQSFGGFCVLANLSRAPHGLRAAYFTGGVPPLGMPLLDGDRLTSRRLRQAATCSG